MRHLLKNLKIIDKQSPFHSQRVNLLIEDGLISDIGPEAYECDEEFDFDGSVCSQGYFDLSVLIGDPGLEHKEDAQSASNAAIQGGFTNICVLPNSQPVIETKSNIKYLLEKKLPISIHPIAALTEGTKGENLTEILDLYDAGALAFSDGIIPIWNTELLLKALQYVSKFNGLIIQRPKDKHLSQFTQMHEGLVSTQLGMKGAPGMAEEILIKRDLDILEYAGGRLHFSQISTAGSVNIIRAAKEKGLNITCDVAFHNLVYTDNNLYNYNTNFKLDPPLREKGDRLALIKGLEDNTIDAICSAHNPQDTESKQLEFDLADFGATGLQSLMAVLNQHCEELSLETIIDKLTYGPMHVHKIMPNVIKKGALASLTIFNEDEKWVFNDISNQSKSNNSPVFGQELQGKCLAVYTKQKLHNFNQYV